MVVKLCGYIPELNAPFESSVIPYGSKTQKQRRLLRKGFESSVIPYGSKTAPSALTATA